MWIKDKILNSWLSDIIGKEMMRNLTILRGSRLMRITVFFINMLFLRIITCVFSHSHNHKQTRSTLYSRSVPEVIPFQSLHYYYFLPSAKTAFFFFPDLAHSFSSFPLPIPTVYLISHHLTCYWQRTCVSAHILWQFFQVYFLLWSFYLGDPWIEVLEQPNLKKSRLFYHFQKTVFRSFFHH